MISFPKLLFAIAIVILSSDYILAQGTNPVINLEEDGIKRWQFSVDRDNRALKAKKELDERLDEHDDFIMAIRNKEAWAKLKESQLMIIRFNSINF